MESEYGEGNILLLVGVSNSNRRMVEMLVVRGANVNHQNSGADCTARRNGNKCSQ